MSNYAREIMKNIFMMRSHHMLTDVVLEVQQELFHAHKVILSAASPYFKAMFTGGLKECEMSRIKLQGVSMRFIIPRQKRRKVVFLREQNSLISGSERPYSHIRSREDIPTRHHQKRNDILRRCVQV